MAGNIARDWRGSSEVERHWINFRRTLFKTAGPQVRLRESASAASIDATLPARSRLSNPSRHSARHGVDHQLIIDPRALSPVAQGYPTLTRCHLKRAMRGRPRCASDRDARQSGAESQLSRLKSRRGGESTYWAGPSQFTRGGSKLTRPKKVGFRVNLLAFPGQPDDQ